jgi:hypothetical protein
MNRSGIDCSRGMAFCTAAVLLLGLCPALATGQTVRGHGKISNGPDLSPSQISVNVWVDDTGAAQGMMAWTGDIPTTPPYPPGTGGPSEPFIVGVYGVLFDGNSAFVFGIVVNSPQGAFDGEFVSFTFTDNSATGDPDQIDGQPILAGNITIRD